MGNILNFNFNNLDLRLSNSEYYDFWLGNDEDYSTDYSCMISGSCLVSNFNFNDSNTINSSNISKIYSLNSWGGATNLGVDTAFYGLTGMDNGDILITINTGDTTNQIISDTFLNTTLTIPSGDTRFIMHQVSGLTNNIVYPLGFDSDLEVGDFVNFNGGFYQGYYKLEGFDYEVLPNRVNKGLMYDFWLNKNENSTTTGTTLNDLNPNNKGFFFYHGTRAENKFWNQFAGNNTGTASTCPIGATEFCTIPKEIDVELLNSDGLILPLNPPLIEYKEYDNGFLLYGRSRGSSCQTCGGFRKQITGLGTLTASEVTGATPSITISGYSTVIKDTTNGFLLYGRSKGNACKCSRPSDGYGRQLAGCYSGLTETVDELDFNADIIDNALGFRIKDDGSIGYRLLTVTATCVNNVTVTGVTIKEEYSISGMVQDNKWEHVSIRWVADYEYDDCDLKYGKPRNGRLMFYVNCRLKFVVENFMEFIPRKLNDYKEKQIGVPFNISLGGGSQGLLESMTLDGQDPSDLSLAIEENFSGTFIGSISQFRIYQCDINWCALKTLC